MTVRKLIELIDFVNLHLKDKGFKSRLQDYIVTIQNNASNLVLLKEINDRIIADFDLIVELEVPAFLKRLLLNKTNKPFTDDNNFSQLIKLKEANHTDYNTLYNQLNSIITTVQQRLDQNLVEIDNFRKTLIPFLNKDYNDLQQDDNSIFAIIFSNPSSYHNLKCLSIELKRWNTTLFLYQQVISDTTPKEFEIVEVDQGSVEFVINIDFKIVENILELFKVGLEVYGAYLLYKSTILEIVKTYRGNEKLIHAENEREKLLLENVKIAIRDELKKQAKANDVKIKDSIDKKIEEVTKVVTEHIVKGNSIKVLSAPSDKGEEIFEKEEAKEQKYVDNKKNFEKLDEATRLMLLGEFCTGDKDDDKN